MKWIEGLYALGTVLSLAVGVWHFFVPWMFQWYSYIPSEYKNLVTGIDWVNLCFSFMLCGLSLISLLWRRRVFAGNREALSVFGFLTAVWGFRVVIAVVEPWPLEPVAWAAYGQLGGSVLIMIFLVVSFLGAVRAGKL